MAPPTRKSSAPAVAVEGAEAGGASRGRILTLLRRHGPLDASQLAKRLRMTSVGARLHVNLLRDQGFVAAAAERGGRGRPRLRYSLTPAAGACFPERYGELVANLLAAIERRNGRKAIDAMLEDRRKALVSVYRPRVDAPGRAGGKASLARRVAALAGIQREGGYMPEAGPAAGGGFVLREWNCPIAAASACTRAFCESERRLFASLLRTDVRLEGRRADGAECCTFRVGAPRGGRRTPERA